MERYTDKFSRLAMFGTEIWTVDEIEELARNYDVVIEDGKVKFLNDSIFEDQNEI